jgi:hypothetical protein
MWLLRIMVEQGLAVTFFPSRFKRDLKYIQQLLFLGVAVLPEADNLQLEHELTASGACPYELIILSRPDNCQDYMPLIRQACPAAPVIYDTVDIHFMREARNVLSEGRCCHVCQATQGWKFESMSIFSAVAVSSKGKWGINTLDAQSIHKWLSSDMPAAQQARSRRTMELKLMMSSNLTLVVRCAAV